MLKKTIETVNKLNQSIELNIEPFFLLKGFFRLVGWCLLTETVSQIGNGIQIWTLVEHAPFCF